MKAPTKAMRMVRDWNSSSIVGAIRISPGSAKAHCRIRPSRPIATMPNATVDESIGHRNRYVAPGMNALLASASSNQPSSAPAHRFSTRARFWNNA